MNNLTAKEYENLNKQYAPSSNKVKNCTFAFLIGGTICALGQVLLELFLMTGMSMETSFGATSVTLIFLSAALTGLKVYDNIAKHGGAGTLVPITGFANSVVAPALEFKSEGFVLGLGAKMFIIAGPVLVYGITASVIYGILVYMFGLF